MVFHVNARPQTSIVILVQTYSIFVHEWQERAYIDTWEMSWQTFSIMETVVIVVMMPTLSTLAGFSVQKRVGVICGLAGIWRGVGLGYDFFSSCPVQIWCRHRGQSLQKLDNVYIHIDRLISIRIFTAQIRQASQTEIKNAHTKAGVTNRN